MTFAKRLALFLFVCLTLSSIVLGIVSRKAPEYLRLMLEESLRKPVVVHDIRYYFPNEFELRGVQVKELPPFDGETAFYVDKIRSRVSLTALIRKRLNFDKISVENAEVFIRKRNHKIYHALSDAVSGSRGSDISTAASPEVSSTEPADIIPIRIREFDLAKSRFIFMDYDIAEKGFALRLEDIDARIRSITLPYDGSDTVYEISARLRQGRDERSAELRVRGRTEFATRDTDTNFIVSHVALPHFEPYYRQITPAEIHSGYLSGRINLRIEQGNLSLNADTEIISLLFAAYETDNGLFGLNADQVLSFLKDRSGKLHIQITAGWNIRDKSVRTRDVIRRSIAQSLKNTVLGNVGNLLENTLRRVSDAEIDGQSSQGQDIVNKIKDFLKFD